MVVVGEGGGDDFGNVVDVHERFHGVGRRQRELTGQDGLRRTLVRVRSGEADVTAIDRAHAITATAAQASEVHAATTVWAMLGAGALGTLIPRNTDIAPVLIVAGTWALGFTVLVALSMRSDEPRGNSRLSKPCPAGVRTRTEAIAAEPAYSARASGARTTQRVRLRSRSGIASKSAIRTPRRWLVPGCRLVWMRRGYANPKVV
ncbi:hypothetical protein [Streptomyces sp. wa53]|uniref:hypothetical protein n=1 Tax=unclassified Streptomyces TaxID=2593676 RepID=UPI003C7CB055